MNKFKKGLVSLVALACMGTMTVNAFADDASFGPSYLVKDATSKSTARVKKTDNEDAVVNVKSGLNGSFYVTFRVRCYGTGEEATSAKYIYSIGKHPLYYLTGKGNIDSYYFLRYGLNSSSANSDVNSATVSGIWAP